jgi:hypothetical protein
MGIIRCNFFEIKITKTKKQLEKTPWPLVRKRPIPTERPPLVDEV